MFTQVLDNGDFPLGLFKQLTNKWAVPEFTQELTASRSLHSSTDSTTGAVSNTVFPVLEALGALVSRGAEGLNKLALLAINRDGLVSVLHSLVLVGGSAYKDGPGELFAIRGEIPANRLPAIVQLEAIHLAANSSFLGTLRLEFEGRLTGLTSSISRDFEDSAYQPAVEGEDDGVRLVKSRGLAFVPYATVEIALEQGLHAPITEVISCAFMGLGLQDRAFDPVLKWMQASFTDQVNRIYAGHICMRKEPQRVEFAAGSYRGNAFLAHLRSAFLGHFLPDPGVFADQKEERLERSAGAQAVGGRRGRGIVHGHWCRKELTRRECGGRPLISKANNHSVAHSGK